MTNGSFKDVYFLFFPGETHQGRGLRHPNRPSCYKTIFNLFNKKDQSRVRSHVSPKVVRGTGGYAPPERLV